MKKNQKHLAREMISLELNVGCLYNQFGKLFPEDSHFWYQMAIEENNHAALIKSGLEFLMDQGLFPNEILLQNLDELKALNKKVGALCKKYNTFLPSRETAFQTALKLEQSAGEAHFQNMMSGKRSHRILEMFKRLNEDDKDHAERILNYMKTNNIPVHRRF